MINKQVCFAKIWLQQAVFVIIWQRSDILIRTYQEINTKVPFLEICNVNDSTRAGRLTTTNRVVIYSASTIYHHPARQLSRAITIELVGINS